MIDIGGKIKGLRLKLGLTQEELAARTELSKGFISQLERNLTSPSIATLTDILEALGTDLSAFFSEAKPEKVVFTPEDMFVKEEPEQGYSIEWLVPNAQKNQLEPILVTPGPRRRDLGPGPPRGGRIWLCAGRQHLSAPGRTQAAGAPGRELLLSAPPMYIISKTQAGARQRCCGFPPRLPFSPPQGGYYEQTSDRSQRAAQGI